MLLILSNAITFLVWWTHTALLLILKTVGENYFLWLTVGKTIMQFALPAHKWKSHNHFPEAILKTVEHFLVVLIHYIKTSCLVWVFPEYSNTKSNTKDSVFSIKSPHTTKYIGSIWRIKMLFPFAFISWKKLYDVKFKTKSKQ